MNGMFYEYWDVLEREAQMTWERLTTNELNEVGGNVYKLEKLIRQKYGFSIWEARKQVAALLDRYDKSREQALEEVNGFLRRFLD